jgi:hypothetical protein
LTIPQRMITIRSLLFIVSGVYKQHRDPGRYSNEGSDISPATKPELPFETS